MWHAHYHIGNTRFTWLVYDRLESRNEHFTAFQAKALFWGPFPSQEVFKTVNDGSINSHNMPQEAITMKKCVLQRWGVTGWKCFVSKKIIIITLTVWIWPAWLAGSSFPSWWTAWLPEFQISVESTDTAPHCWWTWTLLQYDHSRLSTFWHKIPKAMHITGITLQVLAILYN